MFISCFCLNTLEQKQNMKTQKLLHPDLTGWKILNTEIN